MNPDQQLSVSLTHLWLILINVNVSVCVCVLLLEERKQELKEAARTLDKQTSKNPNAKSSPGYSTDELLDKVLLFCFCSLIYIVCLVHYKKIKNQ